MERGDRSKDKIRVSGQLAISKERSGWLMRVRAHRHVILVFRLILVWFFLLSSSTLERHSSPCWGEALTGCCPNNLPIIINSGDKHGNTDLINGFFSYSKKYSKNP